MTSKAAAKTMAIAIMLTMTVPTAAPASADSADVAFGRSADYCGWTLDASDLSGPAQAKSRVGAAY
ncbi:Uncharacterised protein [Mycobacteroides abscessus subsp. bolletii]|nr:Uncharacterised protein [Mycobacteroides abscessus subsp. bolletii]SKV19035.1 Uncharacterised protein [Mycobacteroides abscessus subsp. massiliense]SPX72917.1 Uncharacterised protein [Mycobacteroides abscessus]SKG35259.1 Uncharacterised protein [Mycobacteroides abscessus subsp. bolletii]SKV26641.1 Uncharacterised protein [Mycobacteroides abscessus subsp. massiliense]